MWYQDIRNPFGGTIHYKNETDTSMDDARVLAGRGEFGSIALCDYQRLGQGRLQGRRWVSQSGDSLMYSLVFPAVNLDPLLSLKAGLALSFTVESLARDQKIDCQLAVKWPNDVMVNGKKIAGILCKWNSIPSSGVHPYRMYCIVGMGVNVAQKSFGNEIALKAASLFGCGITIDRAVLFQKLLDNLYSIFSCSNFPSEYMGALNARLYKRGESVLFSPGIEDIAAEVIIKGIADDGGIILEKKGRTFTAYSGEFDMY